MRALESRLSRVEGTATGPSVGPASDAMGSPRQHMAAVQRKNLATASAAGSVGGFNEGVTPVREYFGGKPPGGVQGAQEQRASFAGMNPAEVQVPQAAQRPGTEYHAVEME